MIRAPVAQGDSQPDLDLGALTDEHLIDLARHGDALAFEMVTVRHGEAAFSLAYRMCARHATAEDVVQNAFLSLWRTGASYDPTRGTVRSWMLGTVSHCAIDRFQEETVQA